MGLNIYFYNKRGDEVEYQEHLGIAHNPYVKIVHECGKVVGKEYYKLIWRPDELLGVDNGKVPVSFVLQRLPVLISDLIKHEKDLVQYLPFNGFVGFEDLIDFLCDYLKDCYKHQKHFVYCCR